VSCVSTGSTVTRPVAPGATPPVQPCLARPRFFRRLLGGYIRWRSARRKRDQGNVYADLQPAATDDFIRAPGFATFIHGHTHRAATHDHMVDGIHVERWVLGDWHEDRGEALRWDGEVLRREAILPENRA